MNGLDLFSGIGGISLALKPWVNTIAYCEQDRYAQSVLLSRIVERQLDEAPIWDDVVTLRGDMLPRVDIIFGGFPCQDISTAGRGAGLEGKRSGLFFEICRLVDECKPSFIFLENVPAIRTRGLHTVIEELSDRGYDCRWTNLSAQEVGANHKRDRWFLLAYAESERCREAGQLRHQQPTQRTGGISEEVADTMREGLEGFSGPEISQEWTGRFEARTSGVFNQQHWATEPTVGRVVNGLPNRVDRIKCLGNSVVPAQARQAFKELAGIGS